MELVFSGGAGTETSGNGVIVSGMQADPSTHEIIRMAWEDRTSFEEIEKKTGLSEAEVIKVMRRELKPTGFRLWRKRVRGRITKHRRRFEREILRRPGEESAEELWE